METQVAGLALVWVTCMPIFFVTICLLGANVAGPDPETIAWEAHERVVQTLESEITTLRWVGTGVIGGLIGAISILWFSLQSKDRAIIDEIKASTSIREEFLNSLKDNRVAKENLARAIESLEKKIEYCPGRLEREIQIERDRRLTQ